jgi:dolichyl-phosphate beta-glucosyltransferase
MESITPFVSVIIPAYNEEARLATRLEEAVQYYTDQNYSAEIIVVDDGSTDRTPEIVRELMMKYSCLTLLQVPHGGKGHACKNGVFASHGEWLFLCDSDLSMPLAEFSKFVALFQENIPIVIASREAPGARRFEEPQYRHIMGRVFNGLVSSLAVSGIRDTQCGFKCYRADVGKKLFAFQTINGWGFDVEILFVAQKFGYYIHEVPINWYYRTHRKVKPIQDTFNMLRDIWQIRMNEWRGHYKL